MNIYDILLSKNYDCMYNLEELINYNEGKCIIDINFKRHKTDECFNQFALLFKSPKNNGNYLELGIAEDGFVYLGETYLWKNKEYKELNAKLAICFMLKYKNMINAIRNFEYDLGKIVDNNEYINISYDNNYYKEKSQNIEFKFKDNINL